MYMSIRTYLIVHEKGVEISNLDQVPDFLISKTDSIIEVAKPDDSVMIFDGAISLKSKSMRDRGVIPVAFVVISKASGEMGSNKT